MKLTEHYYHKWEQISLETNSKKPAVEIKKYSQRSRKLKDKIMCLQGKKGKENPHGTAQTAAESAPQSSVHFTCNCKNQCLKVFRHNHNVLGGKNDATVKSVEKI